MIIKMQRSVDSWPKGEQAILISNDNRNFTLCIPLDSFSIRALKGRDTAYFEATLLQGQLAISAEVSNPGF